MLFAAIDKERKAAIARKLAGKANWRPRQTPEITAALVWLYDQGVAHADAEMRSMGIPTSYATPKPFRRLLKILLGQLGEMLGQMGFRITREEAAIKARISAPDMVATAMEKRVPGALDAASRLVSSAMAQGLDDRFLDRSEFWTAWIYTAILDGATCDVCRKYDGRRYKTFAEISKILNPVNMKCRGDGRCRCRAVPSRRALAA